MSPTVPPPSELSQEGLTALGAGDACDREPIHLSGAIQPNGYLFGVDPLSLIVAAASANVGQLIGRVDPLGVALADVLGPDVAAAVAGLRPTGNPHDALPVRVELPTVGAGPQAYDLVAHRSGALLLVELEAAGDTGDPLSTRDFRDAMKALLTVDEIDDICSLAVQEIRELTGYDRVMIYRFEPDAHGHVIAEACREDAERLLGLHYPATDIPRQARVMYLRNWIRVIADVDYSAVTITASPGGLPSDQLDLSMSVLRSVSPVHLEYLRNMGVAATMTISLIVDNRLWGMIACHHDTPKRAGHVQRLACEALGQLISTRLRNAESAHDHERFRELGRMAAQVVTAMAAGENPAAGAAAASAALLGMVAADGAVVEVEGTRISIGVVPDATVVDVLVAHLGGLAGSGPAPVATEKLPDLKDLPGGAGGLDVSAAAGSLFLPLPGHTQGFVLWLRGERAQTVRWAGRPEAKSAESGTDIVPLSPRASFAEWREDVRGHSLPWRAAELAAAAELAQAMPEVLMHRAQNRLVRLALHDPLTGLPNRVLLLDRLDEMLRNRRAPADHGSLRPAVLFVDIDGFKVINDTHGHLIGDELLTIVAQRIAAIIRAEDTVARMGGDEFVVLLPDTDPHEAVGIGQRIVEDFRRSFLLGGRVSPSLSLSVGVAMVEPGAEPGEALRQADAAMYHAKRSGRDQVAVYDPASGTAASRQRLAGDELRDAIASGQITVHYQPILDLTRCRSFPLRSLPPILHGFEALARWQHPTRGLVPPDQFIALAEETGLIDALGDTVMRQALRQLQAWSDRGLTMAVNVSVRQLLRPGFASEVLALLVEVGIEPDRLCLEITESQVMERPDLALAALSELAGRDVCIGIDDFGTGFSSLAYVRDLPASVLKIDRLFVSGLPDNAKDVAVVAATIGLAHSLGMRTVAEGVETDEQLATLCELGSDFAQGYLLGRPVSAQAVERAELTPRRAVTTAGPGL